MPPRIVPADRHDEIMISEISGHLERGGLLGYPTETVYGLGAAVDPVGIGRLRALKGRDDAKPFLVLVPSVGEPERMGLRWSESARRLADAFWPGPLTLVLPAPAGRQPAELRGPTGGVAVRLSPDPFVRALMDVWARPLLSTSANVAGEGPARTAPGLVTALQGRPGLERLWVADGGPLAGQVPSTLVDCAGGRPRLVRPGPIEEAELSRVVPDLEVHRTNG